MEKNNYASPEMEIIDLNISGIICDSGNVGNQDGHQGGGIEDYPIGGEV